MFDIVLTACLAATGPCADRLLPGDFPDVAACEEARASRVAAWAGTQGLTVADSRCESAAASGASLDVVELAEGVFVHQGAVDVARAGGPASLANLGFVIGERSVAVIDAGLTRGVAERLWRSIRERTALPVSHVILTHMHPDHALGAGLFAEAGAKVVAHPKTERALSTRAANYMESLTNLLGAERLIGTRPVLPEAAETVVELGGRTLTLFPLATAHTDNDLLIRDEQTEVLFAGDVLFHRHVPALDGSLVGWVKVLESLPGAQIIVPGHGDVLQGDAGLEDTARYLRTLASDVRQAIARGDGIAVTAHTAGEAERELWELFDEFNARNATAAYKELEWE